MTNCMRTEACVINEQVVLWFFSQSSPPYYSKAMQQLIMCNCNAFTTTRVTIIFNYQPRIYIFNIYTLKVLGQHFK